MSYDMAQKEAIYRDYHDKVYGYVISKVCNVQIAEDLTSDIFLKIYEKIDTFDADAYRSGVEKLLEAIGNAGRGDAAEKCAKLILGM